MAWLSFILFFTFRVFAADVVYIGDSHSAGCFGEELDKAMRTVKDPSTKRNLTVRSEATCMSRASTWMRSPYHTTCDFRSCTPLGKCVSSRSGGTGGPLSKLLEESKNTKITVVALGTNMIPDKIALTEKSVSQMIDLIKKSGSKCIWVGPPQAASFVAAEDKFNEYIKTLKKTVQDGGCIYINSDDKTNREDIRDTMGLHYTCNQAKAWAEKIKAELLPKLEEQLRGANPVINNSITHK